MRCWDVLLLAFLTSTVTCSIEIKAKNGTKVEVYKANENLSNEDTHVQTGRPCSSVKDCEGFSRSDLGEECRIVFCSKSNQCECVY